MTDLAQCHILPYQEVCEAESEVTIAVRAGDAEARVPVATILAGLAVKTLGCVG